MISIKDLAELSGISIHNIYQLSYKGLLPLPCHPEHYFWLDDQKEELLKAIEDRPTKGRHRKKLHSEITKKKGGK